MVSGYTLVVVAAVFDSHENFFSVARLSFKPEFVDRTTDYYQFVVTYYFSSVPMLITLFFFLFLSSYSVV